MDGRPVKLTTLRLTAHYWISDGLKWRGMIALCGKHEMEMNLDPPLPTDKHCKKCVAAFTKKYGDAL